MNPKLLKKSSKQLESRWNTAFELDSTLYLAQGGLSFVLLFLFINVLKDIQIMLDLLYQGGPLFMGILTILFFIIIFLSIKNGIQIFGSSVQNYSEAASKLNLIKSIGLLALIIGVLGQLLGLYSAFSAMEGMEDGISTAMLAGGLKVSMITTIYGAFIYVISLLVWMTLRTRMGTLQTGPE